MKNSLAKILLILILAGAFLSGCKSLKKSTGPTEPSIFDFDKIIEKVHNNHLNFNTFQARISANTKFGDNDYVFNGTLRIVKDSAIYISATLPIISEVARVVITPDSLKFLNRLEGLYFVGDIAHLNRILGADVDYQMLEALILGNDFTHFSHNGPLVANDKNNFVVTSNKRVPINNPFATPLQNRMWIDSKTFRISQNIFMDAIENRMIRTTYKNHRVVQNQSVPVELEMLFSEPSNSLFVSLQLSRITLDSEVNINFSVPSGYKPMDL